MAEEHEALARLLRLVGEYQAGRLGQAELAAALAADPGLAELARRDAGALRQQAGKLIQFGDQSQLGDVQIRDVAGGDIINLTLNVGPAAGPAGRPPAPGPPGLDPAEAAHTRELIAQHRKRLNILELQAARFGIMAPPHITIEIDELKARIAELKGALGEA